MQLTINLRPGQKRASGASPFALVGDQLRALGGRVKEPTLMLAAAAWVAVVLWLGFMWVSSAAELSALEPRLEQARAENRRFKTFLNEKRKQEKIRDSLLVQIGAIRSVDGERFIWPHLLDEIARATPSYTWLTRVSVLSEAGGAQARTGVVGVTDTAAADTSAVTVAPPLEFEVQGRTVDIQAYTRFLRQLEASPWIETVIPVSAQTVVEEERAVTAFTIRASFQRADSAYIRTVPFSQSVR
jgi:Tfp pilus assembly protein PilN